MVFASTNDNFYLVFRFKTVMGWGIIAKFGKIASIRSNTKPGFESEIYIWILDPH